MIDLQSVSMFFKIEVLREERFTQEQKDDLIKIAEKIEGLRIPKNPFKIPKLMKEYDKLNDDFFDKFEKYGGDMEKLNENIDEFGRNVKNQIIPYHKELEAMLGKLRGK